MKPTDPNSPVSMLPAEHFPFGEDCKLTRLFQSVLFHHDVQPEIVDILQEQEIFSLEEVRLADPDGNQESQNLFQEIANQVTPPVRRLRLKKAFRRMLCPDPLVAIHELPSVADHTSSNVNAITTGSTAIDDASSTEDRKGKQEVANNMNVTVKNSTVQEQVNAGTVIKNVNVTDSAKELGEDYLNKLETEFREYLKENIKNYHGEISIPASKQRAKLSEAVLNLKVKLKKEPEESQIIQETNVSNESEFAQYSDSDSDCSDYSYSYSYSYSDSDSDTQTSLPIPESEMQGANSESVPDTETDMPYQLSGYTPDENLDEESSDDFQEPVEFIEICSTIESGNRLVIITAPGGRGKTTIAKKIMWCWGNDTYFQLQGFSMVIWIDAKYIDNDSNLFENFVKQYNFIEGKFSPSKWKNLPEVIRQIQERIVWMVDGLDESANHSLMETFIKTEIGRYEKSSFIFLTREEGKEILGPIADRAVEFTLCNLDENLCQEFIKVYPFSENKFEKTEELSSQLQINVALKSMFSVPINAAMICRLFDDKGFDGYIKDELDIIGKNLAMNIKAAQFKQIEGQLAKDYVSKEEKERLDRKKRKLLETPIDEVHKKNKEALIKLGHAIYKCNGNSVIGFTNLKEWMIEEALQDLNVTEEDRSLILRLDIFEKILDGDQTILRFYHRNIREYLVSLFLISDTDRDLVLPREKGKLQDAHLAIFKCAAAQLFSCLDLDGKFVIDQLCKLIKYIFESCKEADEWRLLEIIFEAIFYATQRPEMKNDLQTVLLYVIKVAKKQSFPINPNWADAINKGILDAIVTHAKDLENYDCQSCISLTVFSRRMRSLFQRERTSMYNWPENQPVVIIPFVAKTDEYIVINLPTESGAKHVTQGFQSLLLKKNDTITSPIPLQYCETDFQSRFGSYGVIAECIDGNIFVWGGVSQKKVYIYNVKEKSWKTFNTSGEVHPGYIYAASVELNRLIYLFGGWPDSNRLSSLSLTGEFRRVPIKDDSMPYPRNRSVGWTYNGNLYFAFGHSWGPRGNQPKREFIKGGAWTSGDGEGFTNEVLKFDLREKSFSFLTTKGPSPAPREDCGFAKLPTKVFIHGGGGVKARVRACLRDFFVLDLISNEWTELKDYGLPFAKQGQSLTALGPRQIMLMGGYETNGGNPSNAVKIYDLATSIWKEDQTLSLVFPGRSGGPVGHKSVAVKENERVTKVITFGGTSHLLEFDVEATSQ